LLDGLATKDMSCRRARSDPLPGGLGRAENVVDVPVRLEIDEGNRAIVLVGGQEQQAAVTGPLMRL